MSRKAAKIPDLTFRMLRTTFATLYNGDLKDAQEILGHHSAAFTLERYRKPLPDGPLQPVKIWTRDCRRRSFQFEGERE